MGITDIVKLIKFDELTDKQRDDWKKRLEERRRDLQAALRAVERGLEELAKKPRPKRPAKRKPAGKK